MNKEENIRNRFSGFEADADDATIETGWEKIKYFVPQKENKKRAGFFLLYGTILLFVVLGTATLFYLLGPYHISTTNKALAIPAQKTIKNNVIAQQIYQTNENDLVATEQTNKTETEPINSEKNKHSVQNKRERNFAKQFFIGGKTKKETSNITVRETRPLNTSNLLTINNSIVFQKLEPIAVFIATQKTPAEINIPYPDYFFPKPVSLYSIDVFAGVQFSQTHIKQNTLSKNNSTGFLIGASLNYHLRNRFNITGQFVFSKPGMDYNNTFSQNKIISQSLSISSTSAGPDTVRYVLANTNYFIRSKDSYHAALGFEYELMQKKRMRINAAMLLNVRFTQYDYGYTRTFGKEVLVHVKGTPDNPKDNLAPPSFVEEDQSKSKDIISAGIMPGAVLSYRLNSKALLVLKPSYFIEFTEDQFIINSSAFKLKENNLMLNLGLRINL